jgi:hypothetical protein
MVGLKLSHLYFCHLYRILLIQVVALVVEVRAREEQQEMGLAALEIVLQLRLVVVRLITVVAVVVVVRQVVVEPVEMV